MYKRRVRVLSGKQIPRETVLKIISVFKESYVPNEAMRDSVEGFTSFDGYKTIQLYPGDEFISEFDVEIREED